MVKSKKPDIKIILIFILLTCLTLVSYNFFRNEYYAQMVDLKCLEKIELVEDITTIQDFRPEGINVDWKHHEIDWQGKPSDLLETLSITHAPSKTNVFINLYRNRERAAQGYIFRKNSPLFRIQTEKIVSPNDAYCISKVVRLREEDLGYLTKTNEYYSEIVFVKNNLLVSIYSYNYYDKSGSSKQIIIDIIADYLEKYASKKKTL